MGIKFTDMTTTTADGTESVPASKAAAPRSVTVASVKNYVVDAIEAIAAGTTPTGADSVFVLQGGALKPIDIDLVAQHAIDTIWAKATATPVGVWVDCNNNDDECAVYFERADPFYGPRAGLTADYVA